MLAVVVVVMSSMLRDELVWGDACVVKVAFLEGAFQVKLHLK